MFSPNILITNYCNQNCSFCFAKQLMSDSKILKEMSIENFKRLLKKIKRTKNTQVIKLFGGEPTLHPQFKAFVELALNEFPYVNVFTNGIVPDEKINVLQKHFPRISFIINMQTPGFEHNPQIQQKVIDLIKKLSAKTGVTLSINIYPVLNISKIVNRYKKTGILKNIKHIRLGCSNPIAYGKNHYSYNEFHKLGLLTMQFIRKLIKISPRMRLTLDCGFTPCMFSEKNQHYLTSVVSKKDWGCTIGNLDIDTSLTAFSCYPLSKLKQFRLHIKDVSIKSALMRLMIIQYAYQDNLASAFCKQCKFYGQGKNKCTGPCMAFLINNKNSEEKISL